MISIQNSFDDIMQCYSNYNDFIMLKSNDLVKVNSGDIITVNDSSIPINGDNNFTVNDNEVVVLTNNYDDTIPTMNNVHTMIKYNTDNKITDPVRILNVDDVTLASLKEDNVTSTARSILQQLYRDMEINFK